MLKKINNMKLNKKEIKILHKTINLIFKNDLQKLFDEKELNELCDLIRKYKI